MSEVLKYLAVLILMSIAAAMLPKLKPPLKKLAKLYIKFRVNRKVKKAEKKFSGAKMGEQKKAWVLEQTQSVNRRQDRKGPVVYREPCRQLRNNTVGI